MPSYAAFIGHQPHISLAELAAAAPGFRLLEIVDKSAVLFESDVLPEGWMQRLGGTITFAEGLPLKNPALADVPAALYDQVKDVKGKATFAIRTAGLEFRVARNLYRDCKEYLKKHGKPSRYVGNERTPAASPLLRDAGLLSGKEGREIVVIEREEGYWLGVTRDAQDVQSYTKRDMEKPVRDTGVGLLPPKLAQILLNFAVWLAEGDAPRELSHDPEAKKTKRPATRPFTVFDPFCGTGVIPIECLLRGYAVLASDKAEKAMTGCEKNLDWVRRHWKILKTDLPSKVWKQDATKPFELPFPADAVVTETSLGPSLKKRPTAKEATSLRSDAEHLEEAFLKNAAATLPGIPLVVTWPVWYYSKGPLKLERVWEKLEKLGYKAVLPPHVVSQSGRESLIYRRPDQMVGREIVLLKPLKKK